MKHCVKRNTAIANSIKQALIIENAHKYMHNKVIIVLYIYKCISYITITFNARTNDMHAL